MTAKTKAQAKSTTAQLIEAAIANFKDTNEDWKQMDEGDLYGVESDIDALLYEAAWKHLAPNYGNGGNDELVLERLTFAAIKKLQGGKRHQCDPLYDDAFGGKDGN